MKNKITPLLKRLNDHGIKDGLLRNFASQEPRNDKAVLDAISEAVARRESEIEYLQGIREMVLSGDEV